MNAPIKYQHHNWSILLCIAIICVLVLSASILLLWENVFSSRGSVSYEMPQQRGTVLPDANIMMLAYETINSGGNLATFYMDPAYGDREGEFLPGDLSPSVMRAAGEAFLLEDPIISVSEDILKWHKLLDFGDDAYMEGEDNPAGFLAQITDNYVQSNPDYLYDAVNPNVEDIIEQSEMSASEASTENLDELASFKNDALALGAFLEDSENRYIKNIKKGNSSLVLERVTGTIDDNLYTTMGEIGENPQLALSIEKLFGSEINFIRHIKPGSTISILVEKEYENGIFKDYGRILAARLFNAGKVYEAFLFRDATGKPQYYNSKGENLHKTLLQSPLAVTRKTSGFSHNRLHPILNISRPHLGVDYAAPVGTPVKAVGDGVVSERGWNGGFGNLVILKHDGGLESMYGHLAGFARGLKAGQKIKQGQVIGYVGSTGMATGPHLDFRLRQNGKYINPEKVVNPRSAPVMAALQKEFQKIMKVEKAYLAGEKTIAAYTPTSIVPAKLPASVEKALEKELREERLANNHFGRKRMPPNYEARRRAHTPRQKKILNEIRRRIGKQLAARFQTTWR